MESSHRRSRAKHCFYCKTLFDPDPRTKGYQRYCSRPTCQTHRQRKNERDWRVKNPDCLAEQRKQTSEWHRAHPQYSRNRRQESPKLLRHNRECTQERMRRRRAQGVFDKSKSILTQVVGVQQHDCYLTRGHGWLMVRLTKASPLSKRGLFGYDPSPVRWVPNRLPRGRLYDVSGVI